MVVILSIAGLVGIAAAALCAHGSLFYSIPWFRGLMLC